MQHWVLLDLDARLGVLDEEAEHIDVRARAYPSGTLAPLQLCGVVVRSRTNVVEQ